MHQKDPRTDEAQRQETPGKPARTNAAMAIILGLFFLFLELIKDARNSQWSGVDLWGWLGVAAGFVIYSVTFWLLAAIVYAGLGLPRCFREARKIRSAASAFFAGAVVWACLSAFREFAPTADDMVVMVGVAGIALAFSVLPERRWSLRGLWACAAISLIGGMAATQATGQLFLFAHNRADMVTLAPLLWLACTAALGMAAWTQNAGGFRRAAHLLIVLGPPLVLLYMYLVPGQARPDAPPNLLFVVADTLRADSLRLYGGPVAAPTIESLAAEGAVFEQCTSLAPWTPPSMEGMFRSQYPSGLTPGVDPELWLDQLWRYDVKPEEKTLAELLHARGYATGALIANALLTTLNGMNQGYETRAFSHPMLLRPHGFFEHLPFLQDLLASAVPSLAPVRPEDTTAALTRYTRAFLRHYAHRPFYLWLHYMDPHAPYDPPQRLRTQDGPWPFFHPFPGGERWGIPIVGRAFNVREQDRPFVRSLYESEVQYLDEQLGRVLTLLDRLGLRERTFVCFLADHGEELWEHNEWGHGQSLFQELVHVPWILTGPGIAARRTDVPVSSLSVTPTLADLLGVPREPYWRGESLAAFAKDAVTAPTAQPVFALGTSNKAYPEPLQMIRDGQYKLIREAGSGRVRLYDLVTDPFEQQDLGADQEGKTRALGDRILEWLPTFQNAFPIETSSDVAAKRREIEQQLDAMGYLH